MHDIWNPWHGCKKYSEGCDHCYMYYLDKMREKDGSVIYKTKSEFNKPLSKNRQKEYKIQSGELIRVCMTSDFFLEDADVWRDDVWNIIRQRPDVIFYILTKRAERIKNHLPKDWGDGYENVLLNVTCENQQRADERIPILLSLPAKHKGIMCAPLIGPIDLSTHLQSGQIEQVACGGENYDGCRPCHYEWVEQLSNQCKSHNITFAFTETGTIFMKNGITHNIPSKPKQAMIAGLSNLNHKGKPINWLLKNPDGSDIEPSKLYIPKYKPNCKICGGNLTCNGCSDCGKCNGELTTF